MRPTPAPHGPHSTPSSKVSTGVPLYVPTKRVFSKLLWRTRQVRAFNATLPLWRFFAATHSTGIPFFPCPPSLFLLTFFYIVQRHNSTLDPVALPIAKLNPLKVWKVYFRLQWGCCCVIQSPPVPLHCALYFQATHHSLSCCHVCVNPTLCTRKTLSKGGQAHTDVSRLVACTRRFGGHNRSTAR